MRRIFIMAAAAFAAVAVLFGAMPGTGSAGNDSRVRVVHASPDAPAVDVYADGTRVLSNVAFKGASDYLTVPAGAHNFQVFAAGANPSTDEPVIDADATLAAGKDYTIAAVGRLADIAPAVFEDNNSAPAAGKAHVRVIHASPDAPAVDVAVAGGPVLFPNVTFPNAAGPSPVDAGTYDLEVRAAGTTTVALPIADVQLQAGKIYTVFAVGLLNGTPALEALPIVNDPISATAAAPSAPAPSTGGTTALPSAGMGSDEGGSSWMWLTLAGAAGIAIAATGTLAFARSRGR